MRQIMCLKYVTLAGLTAQMIISGILPLLTSLFLDESDWVVMADSDSLILGVFLVMGLYTMFLGWLGCYSVCYNKKAMNALFVLLMIPSLIAYFILLRVTLLFRTEGESELRALCHNNPSLLQDVNFDNIESYDSVLRTLGQDEAIFCSSQCPCSLAADTNYWVEYDAQAKIQFTAATQVQSQENGGITRIQECGPKWQQLDRPTRSLFNIMSRIEASHNCAGVCIASNIAIASDTKNSKVNENYQEGQRGCFKHVVSSINEISLTVLIYAACAQILHVLVASMVCCLNFTNLRLLKRRQEVSPSSSSS